jgi:hypothetical protein
MTIMTFFSGSCPICGGVDFLLNTVLWPKLINDWQLSSSEVDYVNRQQGFCCTTCGNNLRAMVLADAILTTYASFYLLNDLCFSIWKQSSHYNKAPC